MQAGELPLMERVRRPCRTIPVEEKDYLPRRRGILGTSGLHMAAFRLGFGDANDCPESCPVREPNRDLEAVYLCGERCLFPMGHAGPHECAGHAGEVPDRSAPEPYLIYRERDRARPL